MFIYNSLNEFIISAYGCVSNEITYRDGLKQFTKMKYYAIVEGVGIIIIKAVVFKDVTRP